MKHLLLLVTLITGSFISNVAIAQMDIRTGTFNVRGDDYTYRLSVHPDGFVVLENFDAYRYGTLADGGATLTFTLLPSDEPSLMAFQPTEQATYNVTTRDALAILFENETSGSFLVMKTKDTPRDAVPANIRTQLANAAQQAVATERVEGVSVSIDDFVGRWERDSDDIDLVLEFLPSGGYRATRDGAVFYGTVSVTGTELTLNGFGASDIRVIPIKGINSTRSTFYATENGESIMYRRKGELSISDADIAVARTLVSANAASAQQPQQNNNFAQAIIGKWQTIIGEYIVTADYRADNTYSLSITSLTANERVDGTYSVQGNTVTQVYADGSQVSTLDSLVAGSFMTFVGANNMWIALGQAEQASNSGIPSNTTATNALPSTTTANTSSVNGVNEAVDIFTLTMQHQMEMQQIQMMNDAINSSAQMGQTMAWDISDTAWTWDYSY